MCHYFLDTAQYIYYFLQGADENTGYMQTQSALVAELSLQVCLTYIKPQWCWSSNTCKRLKSYDGILELWIQLTAWFVQGKVTDCLLRSYCVVGAARDKTGTLAQVNYPGDCLNCVQEVSLYSKLLYKMGNYFLDINYTNTSLLFSCKNIKSNLGNTVM